MAFFSKAGSNKPVKADNENLVNKVIELENSLALKNRELEDLKKNSTRYQTLFEAMRDGVVILTDDTGMIVDVNSFLIDLLGYSKTELLGKKIWELGFLKDVVANKSKFRELKKKGYIHYENLPLKTKKGGQIDAEFTSSVYTINGKKNIQCIIRDVTKRMKTEEEYKLLFNSTNDTIVLLDVKGKILNVNNQAYNLLGLKPEEIKGRNISRIGILDLKNLASVLNAIRESIMKKGDVQKIFNVTLKHKSGRDVHVEISAAQVKKEGKLIGFIGIIRDVTERMKIEDKLIESEDRYRMIFEGMNDGALGINLKTGKFEIANPSICRLTGYTKDELLKLRVTDIHPQEELDNINDVIKKQLSGKIKVASNLPVLRKDGKIINCDVSSYTLKISGQTVLLGFFRDVTERAEMDKIKSELDAGKRTQELKDELLTIITHDLKQPITPIVGYADLMYDEVIEPKHKIYLEKIKFYGLKMHEMIGKILDLLIVETGKLTLNIGVHDISEAFKEVLSYKSSIFDLKQVKLINKLRTVKARFDYKITSKVLLNLIDNAIKFTPEKGKITLRAWAKGGWAYASIKDSGVGIKKTDLPKLFNKFYQTKEGKELGGTGIGLAVSKKMIEAQKGSITFKSAYGKGSEVIIRLPQKIIK